jgi:HlyD family secretion protein
LSELKRELASLRIERDAPRRSRALWWVALTLIVVVAGGVFAWRTRESFAYTEVDTVTPSVSRPGETAAGTPLLNASGYVVARRKAIVSAKIQGRLSELRVEEASRVRQGDVIARLESADYAAQIQRAKARIESGIVQVRSGEIDLAEARRQLAVAERLAAEKVLPIDQLDATRNRVKAAEARLDWNRAEVMNARADLAVADAAYQNTLIRAPFTGTVVRKMAEVGESVAPIPPGVNISTSSGAIVALADLDTLEVEADVNEAHVARLGPDQPAEVTVEAFPDRRYRAVLRQIIPTADRTKATVQVKVTIIDKDKDLRPEMSAKVTFLERDRPAAQAPSAPVKPVVMVPQEAVVSRGGSPQVFEVVAGRARARSIQTGAAQQGRVVVRDGLVGSEVLISRPPDTLKDGDPVRIRQRSR